MIIHGTEEASVNEEKQNTADKKFVHDLLKDVSYKADPKYIGRISVKKEGKSRPLKIVFESDSQKQGLFGNLKEIIWNAKEENKIKDPAHKTTHNRCIFHSNIIISFSVLISDLRLS